MDILVSINYMTHNHEMYVCQALDSFLIQKTNFAWEILVHDDASEDSTADIIREYADRYPDLIKPVYQSENQYAKGLKIEHINVQRAQGKYIAFCDGDDYWCDPYKLQKQVDHMEAHPECSMCFHKVKLTRGDSGKIKGYLGSYYENCLVPVEDMIGWVKFSQISSILYRRQCVEHPPYFYLQAPVNDVFLVLSLAIQGNIYYLNEAMSVYRTGISGSLSSRLAESRSRRIWFLGNIIDQLEEFNCYTDYQYVHSIKLRQKRIEQLLLIAEGNVQAVIKPQLRRYNHKLKIYTIARIYLNKYCPSLYAKLSRYKN